MESNRDNNISRKEFMFRSTAGILGFGIMSHSRADSDKKISPRKSVEYRTLGRTGLKVSPVGFGTTLTDMPTVVRRVIDRGVNFIDTGRMYANGKNEEMIGRVLKDDRKNIIIQSKFHRKYKDDRAAIEKSIDDSLKALKTDYIDIMLLHAASNEEELNSPATIEALTMAKESGKIRFTGFSSHSNQIDTLKAAVNSKFYDVAMVAYTHAGHFTHSMYDFYQEWDQNTLENEMKRATAIGMGIVAMKTCSAGPLREEGESQATYTAALKWILRNPSISTMAIWMANFKHIEEDIQAMCG